MLNYSDTTRAFINTLNESAYLIDGKGIVIIANEMLARRLSMPVEKIEGSSIYEVLPPEVKSLRIEMVSKAVSERKSLMFEEKRNGQTYLNSVNPIQDDNGDVVALAFVGVDITDRKRIENELLKANEELNLFAGAVSHDVRGPLSAAMLASHLLERLISLPENTEMQEQITEAADIVRRNIEKAISLVDKILDLAKAGNAPVDDEMIDVAELVKEILDERAREIRLKKVSVNTSEDLGQITTDRTQMYQLFSNLVSNAIKHNSNPDPTLHITCLGLNDQGMHRFLVRDNGPGIPPEILDTVFLPFVTGDKGDTGNAGFGLSIVEKIATTNHGYVKAYNDAGACFEVGLMDVS